VNRFIKFDENNISKVIVKYSFILVSFIAFLLIAIYTPKYYYEYKKNTESTKEHLNMLYLERIKFEVNEIAKNIGYRSQVHENYLLTGFENELFRFYEFISEKTIGQKSPSGYDEIARNYLDGDSIGYYFIFDGEKLFFSADSISPIEEAEQIEPLAVFMKEAKSNRAAETQAVRKAVSDILRNGENFIRIRYSGSHNILYGVIISRKFFEKTLKEIVFKEIVQTNLKGSQEYIFVYELLNAGGGKGFAKMIINPNRPDLVGTLLDDDYKDAEGYEFRKEFLRQINNGGDATVRYIYKNPATGMSDLKTSYFKLYPELNWIIAQGYYGSQISSIVSKDQIRYRNDFIIRISLIIILVFVFLTIYYFMFRNFAVKVQETIINYRTTLEHKNEMLRSEIELSKRKQKELSESNEYISNLYDSIPVGVVLIDALTREITNINNSGLEILGYEKEEIIGKVCHFTFCPSLVKKCPILDDNLEIDNSERTVIHKNGTKITVLKKAARTFINGKSYLLESFSDITKIKQTEAELIKMKEKAEQASFEKSRFLANMSHEIRTPMNSIYGMSNILSETELSQEQHDLAETIKASSEILVRILNDILDLSKIESGKISVDLSGFDLVNLIKTVSRPFEIRLKESNIRFETEFIPENFHRYFFSDSLKLSQILTNLLSNAVKFTQKGRIKLSMLCISENEENCTIRFSVSDTGIGIQPKSLEKIFERFSQADISTTRKFGGTGLGLTISKKLVEILGGDLSVISAPGKGSEFSFVLELKKMPENKVQKKNTLTDIELSERLKKINILVAEDNSLNQKYISTLLKKKSANFRIVENGKEAIEELKKNMYDIILMDGQMPEMDGIKTAQTIRNSDYFFRSVPIIALTASALNEDRKKFIDAGMNDYVTKPIDQNELFDAILRQCFADYSPQEAKDAAAVSTGPEEPSDNSDWKILSINDFESKMRTFGTQAYLDIIELLIKELPAKIRAVKEAAATSDLKALKFQAHSLKGVVLNFSAPGFNELCIKLDRLANSGKKDEAAGILKELIPLSEKYLSELRRFVKNVKTDFEKNKG
jgi:PAS domain S-box-containing protein